MPISRLGYVKDGEKKEFPVISALPREMTMAEFALLSDEEKMGDIIVTDYPVNEESDYVEVVGDGVKTYSAIFNELYALVDKSRITDSTMIVFDLNNAQGAKNVYVLSRIEDNSLHFIYTTMVTVSRIDYAFIQLMASGSRLWGRVDNVGEDYSSLAIASGRKITLYYNDAHTFDFNTKAENCIFDPTGTPLSSTNAEDAIKEVATSPNVSLYNGKQVTVYGVIVDSNYVLLYLPPDIVALGIPSSVSVSHIVIPAVGGRTYANEFLYDENGLWIKIVQSSTNGSPVRFTGTITWS